MATISDFYKYAELATAAYVRMGSSLLTGEQFVEAARDQDRLPQSVAEHLFVQSATNPSVWSVAAYYGRDVPGVNDHSGFAATLFKKDGENVLAIRGVEAAAFTEGGDVFHDLIAKTAKTGSGLHNCIKMFSQSVGGFTGTVRKLLQVGDQMA